MLFIAFLNGIKNHFAQARIRRQFQYLDNHSLKDIGFYREHGEILPLAGKEIEHEKERKKPLPQRSDG